MKPSIQKVHLETLSVKCMHYCLGHGVSIYKIVLNRSRCYDNRASHPSPSHRGTSASSSSHRSPRISEYCHIRIDSTIDRSPLGWHTGASGSWLEQQWQYSASSGQSVPGYHRRGPVSWRYSDCAWWRTRDSAGTSNDRGVTGSKPHRGYFPWSHLTYGGNPTTSWGNPAPWWITAPSRGHLASWRPASASRGYCIPWGTSTRTSPTTRGHITTRRPTSASWGHRTPWGTSTRTSTTTRGHIATRRPTAASWGHIAPWGTSTRTSTTSRNHVTTGTSPTSRGRITTRTSLTPRTYTWLRIHLATKWHITQWHESIRRWHHIPKRSRHTI